MNLISSLRFFFREATVNCWRAGMMTVATVSTIAVSLLTTGAFLLATSSVETFLERLQAEAVVTAFLAPGITPEVANNVRLQVMGLSEVTTAELVSPRQSLDELFLDPADRQLLAGTGSGAAGGASAASILPWTLRIKLRASSDLEPLLAQLKSIGFVDDVAYGKEALSHFQGFSELLFSGSLLMIVLLGTGSLFIVANTVRLTLMMRREEIEIMRLVGATAWFIRWPFVIEGLLQGLLGATCAVVVLLIGHRFVIARLSLLVPFFALGLPAGMLLKLSLKMLMLGVVLGVTGSLLTLRDLAGFSRHE